MFVYNRIMGRVAWSTVGCEAGKVFGVFPFICNIVILCSVEIVLPGIVFNTSSTTVLLLIIALVAR